MLIIDAHLDLAWNALQWDRDLRQSVYTIRTQEVATPGKGRGAGTVALPEMRQGKVCLCFATLLARCTGSPDPGLDYLSPAQAYGITRGQLEYYRALEAQGHLRIVGKPSELESHLDEWKQDDARGVLVDQESPALGVVLSMEGADSILRPDQLESWWEAGLRLLGPAHYGHGRYAGGTGSETGFTESGKRLLSEMDRLGIILDLTHLSDRSFWEAIERYEGSVIASHSNCRELVPHQRQFNNEQLKAIIDRNGVIGVCLDVWMLQPGWIRNVSSNDGIPMARVVDHIDRICQLAGDRRHVAIGSDLDGGFGMEQSPDDLDTIADLHKLAGILKERGYSDADVSAIMHGNWTRLLLEAWE